MKQIFRLRLAKVSSLVTHRKYGYSRGYYALYDIIDAFDILPSGCLLYAYDPVTINLATCKSVELEVNLAKNWSTANEDTHYSP